MDLDVRREKGCTVVRPNRDALDYTVCGQFKRSVQAMWEGNRDVLLLLDLQEVAFLDSMAIGALVSLRTQVVSGGGRVALCGLQPFVTKVLAVATVNAIFDIYNDVEQALESLGSDVQ